MNIPWDTRLEGYFYHQSIYLFFEDYFCISQLKDLRLYCA